MSTYFEDTNLIEGVNSTVTSGGTLALVASSKTMQRLTGTSGHTVTLPDAVTLKNVGRRFHIMNRSTGSVIVNNFSGTLLATLTTNTQKDFVVSDVSSSAGVWEQAGDSGSASGGGNASVQSSDTLKLLQGVSSVNYNDGNIASKLLKISVNEMGGNFWLTRSGLGTAQYRNPAFTLNGYAYNAGGQSSLVVERYDDSNNFWLVRASLPSGSDDTGATFDLGGFGFKAGGSTAYNSNVVKYTDSTNAWAAVSSLPVVLAQTTGYPLNGFGYAHSGSSPSNGTNTTSIFRYDGTNDVWSTRGKVITARDNGKAVNLNGYGVAMGGRDAGLSQTHLAEKYNDTYNAVTAIASTANDHVHGGGFSILGFAYLTCNNSGGTTINEQYYDVANIWVTKAPTLVDQNGNKGFDVNGFGYIAGTGATGTNTNRYMSSNLQFLGTVLTSSISPSTILAAASIKNLTPIVPIQLRTDGNNWKSLSANSDTALKFGESLSGKFNCVSAMIASGGFSGGHLQTAERYNDIGDSWISRSSMISTHTAAACFPLNGTGYASGGNNGVNQTIEKYDELADSWTTKATLSASQVYGPRGFELNGFGYQVGGFDLSVYLSTANKYNPTLDSWSAVASASVLRRDGLGLNLLGFGYVASGYNSGGLTATMERYNDTANAWVSVSAPYSSQGPGQASLNGLAYSFGGFNGGSLSTVQSYSPQSNSWTGRASLNSAKDDLGGQFFNGFAYAVGGSGSNANQKYNDASNAWATKTSMSSNREFPSFNQAGAYRRYEIRVGVPPYIAGLGGGQWLTLTTLPISGTDNPGNGELNGFGYAVGGRNGGSNIQSTQKFSDVTKQFTQSFNMASAAMGEVPCGTANGFIYNSKGGTSLNTSQKFNDQTGWVSVASSSASLNSSASSTLNGYYYSTGGSGPTANVEQYTDATNSWATKTSLTSARSTHSAFNLNGFLYVASGNTNQAAEQYNDVSNSWLTRATCSTTQDDAACFALLGFAYVAGSTSPGSTVERYSDLPNIWITAPSLPTGSYGSATGTAFNGNGYGFGMGPGTYNKCYQFSPSLNDIVLGVALEAK